MKTKILTIVIILLAAVMLAGCAGKTVEVPVGMDKNNGTVEVNKGDVIAINLSANPSTGYSWEAQNLDTAILEQVGEVEYKQEKSDQPVVGAPETAIIRIKAVGTGETALKLIYHRSFEQGVDPLDTFFLNVVVK